jgi:hypothetical protein
MYEKRTLYYRVPQEVKSRKAGTGTVANGHLDNQRGILSVNSNRENRKAASARIPAAQNHLPFMAPIMPQAADWRYGL